MHFVKCSLVAFVYASSVIAYPGVRPQDVSPVIQTIVEGDSSLAFPVTESAPLPRSISADPSLAGLEKRDDKQILSCLRALNIAGLSGSFGEKQWNDLHGDSKSKSECIYDKKGNQAYNIQIIHDSDGKYRARVLEGKRAEVTVEVPPCPNNKPPTLGRAIHYLRKKLGGENPPADC
jgi:hypothetical protein